jgi:putative ABC transport system ATP-binding protein
MVTHSMAQALAHGSRTIMLHEGQVMFYLRGDERDRLGVPGLLDLFKQVRGQDIDDDSMVLE